MTDINFWQDKRVLLTGHTGFKGGWLAIWLHQLGARVTGVALPPDSEPNLYTLADVESLVDSRFCDIRDYGKLQQIVAEVKPEIVFNLAAQALVRKSYRQPEATFATNIMGTVNLLETIRLCPDARVVVMVTTNKVYEINGRDRPFIESDRLGGHDPYSASKAASEIVIASYRNSFLADQGVAVASARAGNVIGGGDWSEDRLIPDAIRSWHNNKTLEIRMPEAVRPWQHVLDPLSGYLTLAESLWADADKSGAYNFGPDQSNNATVRDVIESARQYYPEAKVNYGTPDSAMHETGVLSLDTSKAKQAIDFRNRYALDRAVHTTFHWYQKLKQDDSALQLCHADIEQYGSSR